MALAATFLTYGLVEVAGGYGFLAVFVAARAIRDEDDLERLVREQARPGDMVVCLGAGTISAWANGLPARLMDKAG